MEGIYFAERFVYHVSDLRAFSLKSERLFGPLVLLHDLGLLLGAEVVLDLEELADLLDGLALDERGDLRARKLQQGLNIEVVGGHDDLEEHLLVDIHVLGGPRVHNLREVVRAEGLLNLGGSLLTELIAEDLNLLHDGLGDLGDGNVVVGATVFDQASDQSGVVGGLDVHLEDLAIFAHEFARHRRLEFNK